MFGQDALNIPCLQVAPNSKYMTKWWDSIPGLTIVNQVSKLTITSGGPRLVRHLRYFNLGIYSRSIHSTRHTDTRTFTHSSHHHNKVNLSSLLHPGDHLSRACKVTYFLHQLKMRFSTLLLGSFLPLAFSIPISDLDSKTESITGMAFCGLKLYTRLIVVQPELMMPHVCRVFLTMLDQAIVRFCE